MFPLLLTLALTFSTESNAQELRTQRPYAISIEVLGRSMIYGYQFERSIGNNWLIAAAIARVGLLEDSVVLDNTALIPLYVQYYSNRWYLTGGLTLVTNTDGAQNRHAALGAVHFSSLPIIPNVGVGYELRQETGFLFRAQGLILFASSAEIAPGLSVGYCF